MKHWQQFSCKKEQGLQAHLPEAALDNLNRSMSEIAFLAGLRHTETKQRSRPCILCLALQIPTASLSTGPANGRKMTFAEAVQWSHLMESWAYCQTTISHVWDLTKYYLRSDCWCIWGGGGSIGNSGKIEIDSAIGFRSIRVPLCFCSTPSNYSRSPFTEWLHQTFSPSAQQTGPS